MTTSQAWSFDKDALLEHFAGDLDFAKEVFDIFRAESARLRLQIEAAICAGDAETLGKRAHPLKGAVSNFFASR